MSDKIDFIITWLDNTDLSWQSEKEKYEKLEKKKYKNLDTREVRYRNMECLKYWFRGVEEFAPWVNKVYFVTYGHVPQWLNLNYYKLVIVKHQEYIPLKYLPTFNSDTIELNMYQIKGLEEKFVYFNDDCFLLNKVKSTDFFKKGKPCNTMALKPIIANYHNDFYKKICNNMEIINKNFSFSQTLRKNIYQYLSVKQGKYLFRTIPLLMYKQFVGFHDFHMPISYLKTDFSEVWENEKESIEKTMEYKFRNNEKCINHWLFLYWQFARGEFCQRKSNFGKYFEINDPKIYETIKRQKYKTICINDCEKETDFENTKKKIKEAFEDILPNKSKFEI